MQSYIKTYCDYFGYCYDDYIASELSGRQANDIHHIAYRSRLGKDNIENLIALTRDEHDEAHASKLSVDFLQEKHNLFIKRYEQQKKRNGN